MEKVSYFNEIIGNLNMLELEFDKILKPLSKSKYVTLDIPNPIRKVRDALYDMRDYAAEKGFNFYGDDSYIKYIWVAYLEEIVEEMKDCLLYILAFSENNLFARMINKKMADKCASVYKEDYLLLSIYKPEYLMEFYETMLKDGRFFTFFKPGMFYKFTVMILGEMQQLGIEDKQSALNVVQLVKHYEDELQEREFDFSKFDDKINENTDKYHVDFVSLDRDYQIKFRENVDEKNSGNSKTRK